jgi:hypothetical protein
MIKVVRIAGESFDLENQHEMPKALILSNGAEEFSVYVDDETAAAVLKLMLAGAHPNVSMSTKPAPERPVAPTKAVRPAQVRTFEPVHTHENVGEPPPMVEVGGSAAEVEEDTSELEPGEEYNDPATGAESL